MRLKIMQNKSLLSDSLRNKLTQLEYKGLKGKEAKITKLFKEEMGEKPPKFEIYTSEEIGVGQASGFDGAAIHFYDEERKINQVYYIFRGTEPKKDFGDVVYDALGIGVGKQNTQIDDAQEMYDVVETNINRQVKGSSLKVERYGDGHSLGGNLISTLALLKKILLT